ncbi:hypothetical protein JMJ77_0013556 [Colletotrichum scovillei]|uniref:Uncharacterized protein n=1 Tax=Colletotrichum scovillei TaxID=1209932 RepID=A0A9P7R8X8_9PEZI|nr:hypothetical protein JMJ77_0013556 [Colletotrichum scovillei]KAG7069857.1 hypothetical protein JMJ76_0003517 [Colletotrichum scovillei]KAG7073806.1 hypothetical protein JMJ78_0014773 [Colletotrichum scovillei]
MHPYGNTDLREHPGMRDLQRGYRVRIAFYTLRISMSNRRCPLEQIYNLPKPRNAIIKLSHRTNTLHRTRASASMTWTVLGHSVPSDINGNCQNLKIKKTLSPQPPRNRNNLTDRGQASSNDSIVPTSARGQPGSQLGQLLLNPQALAPFCAEISLAHPSPRLIPPRENAELNQTLFGRGLAIPTTLSYSTPGGLKLAKEAKCWQVGQWSTTQHPGLCTMRATCKLPAINVSGEP